MIYFNVRQLCGVAAALADRNAAVITKRTNAVNDRIGLEPDLPGSS
jgi:hypothetical protein